MSQPYRTKQLEKMRELYSKFNTRELNQRFHLVKGRLALENDNFTILANEILRRKEKRRLLKVNKKGDAIDV